VKKAGAKKTVESMQKTLYQEVGNLLSSARERVIIVSAFVRSETLKSLLAFVNSGVKVEIYARWRISDIVAGASDVAVWDVAKRAGADFRVYDVLHAKIYIADENALVGSANATDTGLGRLGDNRSNLEILLKCSAESPEVMKVLDDLRKKSVVPCRFDDELIKQAQQSAPLAPSNADGEDNWTPRALPEQVLFVSQTGKFTDNQEAFQDCCDLEIGTGIDEERLGEVVSTRRIFEEIRDILSAGYQDSVPDNKGCDILINSFYVNPDSASKKWDIIKKWIDELSEDMYVSSARDGSQEVRAGQRLVSENM